MADIQVLDLRDDLSFGAQIFGADRAALEDETVREQLRQVLKARGVVVFREMEPTAKMQITVSKVFGPLKDHPTKATPRDSETGEEEHGVIDMHYVPNSDSEDYAGGLVEFEGQILTRFSPWHFDHCYNDELNYAGVLRSPIHTPERGRTGFLDGVEAYRQLPDSLRERIEGHNVIYTLDTRLTKARFGLNYKVIGDDPPITKQLLKEVAIFPRAMHPAVWTRGDGEKVLHVGSWMAVGIENMENTEGDALLDEISHEVNRLGRGQSAYWHDWSPTDLVIWDNHRMLHAVEGCDPKYERHTIRSTIQGDYGLGYFEDGKKIGEVLRDVA